MRGRLHSSHQGGREEAPLLRSRESLVRKENLGAWERAFAVALFLTLAVPHASQGQSEPPACPPEPRPPDRVGAFSLHDSSRAYPPGTRYRYADNDSLRLDVFVYPISEAGTIPGPEHKRAALREQVAAFKETLAEGLKRGWYERYEIATEETADVATGSDLIPGTRVSYAEGTSDEDVFVSFYSIHALACSFAKVRATMRFDYVERSGWPMDVQAFSQELVAALASRVPTKPPSQ